MAGSRCAALGENGPSPLAFCTPRLLLAQETDSGLPDAGEFLAHPPMADSVGTPLHGKGDGLERDLGGKVCWLWKMRQGGGTDVSAASLPLDWMWDSLSISSEKRPS